MTPKNLLILMSDEHNPKIMGCAGNSIIATPNLDRLAAKGTRRYGGREAALARGDLGFTPAPGVRPEID